MADAGRFRGAFALALALCLLAAPGLAKDLTIRLNNAESPQGNPGCLLTFDIANGTSGDLGALDLVVSLRARETDQTMGALRQLAFGALAEGQARTMQFLLDQVDCASFAHLAVSQAICDAEGKDCAPQPVYGSLVPAIKFDAVSAD